MPEDQKNVDPSQPAAGGWVPSPKEQAIGIGLVSTLGSVAIGAPTVLPGHVGLVVAMLAAALALGITAALGLRSAGPRSL